MASKDFTAERALKGGGDDDDDDDHDDDIEVLQKYCSQQ